MIINEILEQIQDPRSKQGRRYELKSILHLIINGYMNGCTNLKQIHRYSMGLSKKERNKIGFKKTIPSYPIITELCNKLGNEIVSKILGSAVSREKFEQIAIDGKTMRGTSKGKEGLLHIVSAFAVEVDGVLDQEKSAAAGGEIIAATNLLSRIECKNKIITGDAMFVQHIICDEILNQNGDFLFKVKSNQKHLFNSIYQQFNLNKAKKLKINAFDAGADKGHGRIESRLIEVIRIKKDFFACFKIKQIAKITKTIYCLKTKIYKMEESYIATSLAARKASPKKLLQLSVGHWAIENRLHRTKDTIFKEDQSTIRRHISQQNNSSFRNFAIFLLSKINNSIRAAVDQLSWGLKRYAQ